jgi:hypothetical protein
MGNEVSVLTNNGTGGFVLSDKLFVGRNPNSVRAADVNGDGKMDLITANQSPNTLAVLTNNGSGGFTVACSPVVGTDPTSVAVADVNGDGKPDLISANFGYESGNTLSVLLNMNFGSLQVTLEPGGAVNAGAQWQLDGGAWQNNGVTVSNIGVGSHSVSFNTVFGWTTPDSQPITIFSNQTTTAIGAYVQLFGSLQVNMDPAGAVNAGAQWQVDGSAWQNSGATVSGLTLGSHTVSFLMVPANQMVAVNANRTTAAWASYFAPHPATASAIVTNGFVVVASLSDAGIGYTNTPLVYLVGGGGTGAQATATVSNGIVTGITIINAGSGYTNPPIVAITPPFPLMLGIGPATCLTFTNLTAGTNYQLQMSGEGWGDFDSSFVANAESYSRYFDGIVNDSLYRLMALPIPYGATATPDLAFGFVVSATVNDGGSGYVSIPAVQIIGGGGSGAQATATVSNGVVTAINISNAGSGYTDAPTIQIDPPPVPALLPSVVKAFRLDYNGLTPALTYQLQVSPDLSGWTNFGTNFTATDYTISRYLNFETNSQLFRLLQQ